MRVHGLAVPCLPLPLAAPAAPAPEDLGACHAVVEAYDHALVEDSVPASRSGDLEERLAHVIGACEAGDLRLAAAHLEVAKVQYDALFTGPDGPVFEMLVVSRPAAGGDLEYAYVSPPDDDGSRFSL